ncbi:hypothetical protein CGLO_03552 [Colletotrichum gloeosporioides Cg-14]|uniref:Uncharacterized protein n=1 Tax=Colletotrichum gloeosporioides (strain Cg-14) TaxID=1237896 RepID=T0LY29_COLGC|nr:hypothetical protein CGLO_03552 [Colletotrichum gloeosporioides Cg-14]
MSGLAMVTVELRAGSQVVKGLKLRSLMAELGLALKVRASWRQSEVSEELGKSLGKNYDFIMYTALSALPLNCT